jgi:hypothetical protein
VVPKPQNDYYHGCYAPSIDGLALCGLEEVLEQNVGRHYSVHTDTQVSAHPGVLTLRGLGPDYQVRLSTGVDVEVPSQGLEGEDLYRHLQGYEFALYHGLREYYGPGHQGLLLGKEKDDLPSAIQKRTTPKRGLVRSGTFDNVGDKPVTPYSQIDYSDGYLARVYRWLEGPKRKSREKTILPPVYNPAAFNLLMKNTVRIKIVAEDPPVNQ